MPERLMFVQLKSGYDTDRGPCWISQVSFSKSWQTAYFHGLTLRREQRIDGNFTDVDTDEVWWLSGPKRDRTDARYSNQQPVVDEDARTAYEAFLCGSGPARRGEALSGGSVAAELDLTGEERAATPAGSPATTGLTTRAPMRTGKRDPHDLPSDAPQPLAPHRLPEGLRPSPTSAVSAPLAPGPRPSTREVR